MTEFNPFSAADEAPAYVPEDEAAAEEAAGDSRKNVVAIGALAAVALGAGAFFFLGGSGDGDVEEFVPAASAPGAPAAPEAAPAAPAKLPASSGVTLGRNPFRALYVEPVAVAAAPEAPTTGTGTTTPTTTTGGTTTPIVVVDSGPAPAPAPATGGTTAPPPAPAPAPAQSTVALKSVAAGKDGANPTGTFKYDGKEVTGAPGDVMANKLLVISLQQDHTGGWFALLQLGDGSPFEVHENQVVVVL